MRTMTNTQISVSGEGLKNFALIANIYTSGLTCNRVLRSNKIRGSVILLNTINYIIIKNKYIHLWTISIAQFYLDFFVI
jgi:hypothetical protein